MEKSRMRQIRSEQGQETSPAALVEAYHLGAIEEMFTLEPIVQQTIATMCGVIGVSCIGVSFAIWPSGWAIFWLFFLLVGMGFLATMVLFIRSAWHYRGT